MDNALTDVKQLDFQLVKWKIPECSEEPDESDRDEEDGSFCMLD